MTSIRPLHDRVLIRRASAEETTAGGIILTGNKEKPENGVVTAVGKGKALETGDFRPLDVKIGDKVYFGKYAGTELKVDGEELLMMREEDIMAVED